MHSTVWLHSWRIYEMNFREKLENQQIWVYGVSLILGVLLAYAFPNIGNQINWTISPLIGILLYGMFSQIPFLQLRKAISNVRFIIALLIGNFIIVPIIVWILTLFFPQSPPVLLGVCLVLLTPCIDYVIVFTQLGKGDEKLMLMSTPILFIVQMLLLPLYLWLFVGDDVVGIVKIGPFVESFLLLIVAPLCLALLAQYISKKNVRGKQVLALSAWIPVPFMALVLITIVATQIGKVYTDFDLIVGVIPIYILFMIISPIVSRLIAAIFRLEQGAGRALIFSMGTRNSLVVLPLALSLPDTMATIVSAVIVTQTIVELVGELVYIKVVSKYLLR